MVDIHRSFEGLLRYCEGVNFSGYDAYDGLNSKIFQLTPLRKSRVARLALIQFCKRSPIDFRRPLLVEPGYNPKGIGLFLSGAVKLFQTTMDHKYKTLALKFTGILKSVRSSGYGEWCWGYNFDWQSKAFFQPKYTPTVVATSFIANAFLDAYQVLAEKEYIEIARSAADFVMHRLNKTEEGDTICFSYSPLDKTRVYNATALASRLLACVFSLTQERQLFEVAEKSVRFVVNHQNPDGSWFYGTADYQRWIDSFHTGFVLESLTDYTRFTGDDRFRESIAKGYQFFKMHFFLEDGTPKYYHNKIYPIDIHSAAQSIVTLVKFGDVDLARRVAEWAILNMQDKEGYFYYQKQKWFTNKIPYIRWSQAWMFYALAVLLSKISGRNTTDGAIE